MKFLLKFWVAGAILTCLTIQANTLSCPTLKAGTYTAGQKITDAHGNQWELWLSQSEDLVLKHDFIWPSTANQDDAYSVTNIEEMGAPTCEYISHDDSGIRFVLSALSQSYSCDSAKQAPYNDFCKTNSFHN